MQFYFQGEIIINYKLLMKKILETTFGDRNYVLEMIGKLYLTFKSSDFQP